MAHICSCLSTFYLHALYLPLFPQPVNYRHIFILMGCTSLAMSCWVGCLRSTTPRSSLNRHLPRSHNSPAAKGKIDTHAVDRLLMKCEYYSFSYLNDTFNITKYNCSYNCVIYNMNIGLFYFPYIPCFHKAVLHLSDSEVTVNSCVLAFAL